MDLRERLESKYTPEPNTGCWLWHGMVSAEGYGKVFIAGKTYSAHRVSYEVERGSIPVGLQIDHLCRVRNCINPDHLEAVTASENTRRGLLGVLISPENKALRTARRRAWVQSRTHCKNGHALIGDNVRYLVTDRGNERQCRACKRSRAKARYHRLKEARS